MQIEAYLFWLLLLLLLQLGQKSFNDEIDLSLINVLALIADPITRIGKSESGGLARMYLRFSFTHTNPIIVRAVYVLSR